MREAAQARRAAPTPTLQSAQPFSRRGFLVAGMGAAVGAAAGIGAYEAIDDEVAEPPTETIALAGVSSGVTASASLINHTWGVELLLTIRGLEAGRSYEVRYRATDGREVLAGSFVGVETEFLCRMTGALLREDAEAIELVDEDGAVVLSSDLSS